VAGAVNDTYLNTNAVTTTKIADNAVTTVKIADANVTQAKLAAGVAGTGPAFSAYAAATQSISSVTNTKVTFANEEFDTNSNFASSRFTPTVAGYYQVQGSVRAGSSATGMRTMIWKNGTQYKLGTDAASMTNGFVSTLVFLNGSTDYVELYILFGTGQNTSGGGVSENWFNGAMVRSA
jgi:hypothetical protein